MNPSRKQHYVDIGGKTYPLRYEHRDFARAEGRLGFALLGPPSAEFWANSRPAYQTGVLLFVGLLHASPDLTLEQVQDMITFDNAAQIEAAVLAAFSDAIGAGAEATEAPQPQDPTAAAQPTGG